MPSPSQILVSDHVNFQRSIEVKSGTIVLPKLNLVGRKQVFHRQTFEAIARLFQDNPESTTLCAEYNNPIEWDWTTTRSQLLDRAIPHLLDIHAIHITAPSLLNIAQSNEEIRMNELRVEVFGADRSQPRASEEVASMRLMRNGRIFLADTYLSIS